MNFKAVLFGVIALIILAVIIGFSVGGDKDVIKIGIIAPLTGDIASWGQNGLAGVELAVKEINDAGGINGSLVELIVEDDKSTDAVNPANKLINIDNVDALIFAGGSNQAQPIIPIVTEKQIPLILTVASNPDLTLSSDCVFRVYPSDTAQGKFAAEYLYNNLNVKNVAVIYEQNQWATGVKEVFEKGYKGTIEEVIILQKYQQDFKTELTKLDSLDVNYVYVLVYPETGMAFLNQYKTFGSDKKIFGGDMFDSGELITSGFADGVLYTVPKVTTPESFKEEIKTMPAFSTLEISLAAPLGYDAAKVLLTALENVAPLSSENLIIELKKTSIAGMSNSLIEFDNHGDLKTPGFEVKMINNKEAVPVK
ncbi:MAG: ABC transporter substrate-binding protein [Candidatus ainarchaeum sp.]|nr:ABC transporter substrate-binding protein [Candidatus ainarchaeum sp.]